MRRDLLSHWKERHLKAKAPSHAARAQTKLKAIAAERRKRVTTGQMEPLP